MKIKINYDKREVVMKWEEKADRSITVALSKFFPQEFQEIHKGAIYRNDNRSPYYTPDLFKRDFYNLYNAIYNLTIRLGLHNEN